MTRPSTYSRRSFFEKFLGGALLSIIAGRSLSGSARAQTPPAKPQLPTRPLGSTGHQVTLLSLGGEAVLEEYGRDDEGLKLVNRAIDLGVNYIDTSPVYGPSELTIGQVMKTRRNEVFLSSKTHDRTYDGAMRLLEKSLKRLQTDYLDCWQLHDLRSTKDVDFIFAREGVIHAVEKAKQEGIVKHCGITGHRDPAALVSAMQRYNFDTVLMALNAADVHKTSFVEEVIPVANSKKMGILAMKVVARGHIFKEGGLTKMEQAMRYVLTLPISTALIGMSNTRELEENVSIARNFQPLTAEEMRALEEMTKSYHADATWYKERF